MILKPIFGLIIGLFITAVFLTIAGIVVGNIFYEVGSAANETGVYTQVSPQLDFLSTALLVTALTAYISCGVTFILEVVYGEPRQPPIIIQGGDRYV